MARPEPPLAEAPLGAMLRPAVLALLACLRRGVGLQVDLREEPIQVTWDSEGDTVLLDADTGMRGRGGGTVSFSNGSHCLTFMHIPKTGGTFVESKKSSGAYDHAPWGVHDTQLTCKGFGAQCPQPWTGTGGRCCPMSDGNTCSVWHVPPSLDDELQVSYRHGGCDTFCVVREPSARFRSQHTWSSQFDRSVQQPACSTESLDKAVDYKLEQLKTTPYMDDCHLIPQAAYFSHRLGCKHVIKQEHFKEEFLQLMGQYGINVWVKQQAAPKLPTNCHANFSRRAMQKLHRYYSKDYKLLGYPQILPEE